YTMIRSALQRSGYRFQFRVPKANPAVRDRVNLVNALLHSARGESRLLIDPRCKELILDLEQVSYKPGGVFIDKDKDPQRTHLSDALGYMIWQECRPATPAGEQCRRLF
ncbi:MAG: hypothetical protein ABFD89_27430, partial [Bryobacteraceae bacterium]